MVLRSTVSLDLCSDIPVYQFEPVLWTANHIWRPSIANHISIEIIKVHVVLCYDAWKTRFDPFNVRFRDAVDGLIHIGIWLPSSKDRILASRYLILVNEFNPPLSVSVKFWWWRSVMHGEFEHLRIDEQTVFVACERPMLGCVSSALLGCSDWIADSVQAQKWLRTAATSA